MRLFGRQAAYGVGDHLAADLGGLVHVLSFRPLGHGGRGGDGRGAALALELDVHDVRLAHLDPHLQEVASSRIADRGHAVRVGHLAHVPGIQEVIHQDRATLHGFCLEALPSSGPASPVRHDRTRKYCFPSEPDAVTRFRLRRPSRRLTASFG